MKNADFSLVQKQHGFYAICRLSIRDAKWPYHFLEVGDEKKYLNVLIPNSFYWHSDKNCRQFLFPEKDITYILNN